MSDQLEQMQSNIVAAVQQELSRFSSEVDAAVRQIREELAAGAQARAQLEHQVRSLAGALETSHGASSKFQTDLQRALEERLNEFSEKTKRRHDEMNTRLGRVVDEANVGISSAVESAARPIIKQLEHRQDKLDSEVQTLGGSLRKFDEQASQMVGHMNSVTQAIDARLDQTTRDLLSTFDERHAAMVMRLDELSAVAARQQNEVANIVSARVDASEDRTNERLVGLESRINEQVGQRVADIDAHVGRVSAGLDDAVVTLSDRIAKADSKFAEVEGQFAKIREDLGNVDAEAIDEMKDSIQSALGQAELVRIEMDRFKVEIGETVDKTAVRLTELETTVQDQNMDVETAVQLERLEEVERAVLMLDPDQFVRRDELDSSLITETSSAASMFGSAMSSNDDQYSTPSSGEALASEVSMPSLTSLASSASSPLAPPSAGPDPATPDATTNATTNATSSMASSPSLQPPVSDSSLSSS
ncbi:MAG: hypothetical protein ACE37B_12935 [Ilumatobacter sp.]|jgi:seryl-tRNA synthetase|uniref:hypothetical protein n=1 Tax=Ilumatobacter sp. TaxID=1967498 RepID=UPI00391AEB36